jgi:RimJ/RimL family protein N-acetyltransferase
MTRGASWLTGRPAERFDVDGLTLRRSRTDDLDELVAAVNHSLDHLRPWMPWAQRPATPESIGAFLQQADVTWRDGHEFQFAIRGQRGTRADALIGFCGLHDRVGVGALEIGYWVRADCTGRGVATMAAAALTRSALALEGVTRVEIRCDESNVWSAAIPPKLGFRLDRVVVRSPEAPGETDRQLVWVADADGLDDPP